MSNILKIEAFSGASGDMFLSALAGLSNSYDELINLPSLLNFEKEAEIKITDDNKNGIACKHVKVIDLIHEHKHRHLSHILELIKNSKLTNSAKNIAIEIFNIIGEAESEVHGIPLEKIHFHEVGAVDSIIDICGSAYLLDKLKISESFLQTIVTGKGFVKTAHGLLPVPCPATQLILQGIPYTTGDEDGEKLTPTGAAIIKYLKPVLSNDSLIDKKVAYGSGEKTFDTPNVLRLSLCEKVEDDNEVIIIETQIDDFNPEYLGQEFQSKLLEMGAVDFYFTQVIMKKGRPGLLLNIICKKDFLQNISEFIFNFTPTIGIRYRTEKRIELERTIEEVVTEYGKFSVKVSETKDGKKKIKPESNELLNFCFNNNLMPDKISQKIKESYEND